MRPLNIGQGHKILPYIRVFKSVLGKSMPALIIVGYTISQ